MENKRKKSFRPGFNVSAPRMFAHFVKPSFERPKVRSARIDKSHTDSSMIHVCFALYDKTGNYSKFTGTAMLSLFENLSTPPSTCVHLLHDNTLTQDNRDKFIQIAERYGQQLKFYNVEELCADKLTEIEEHFPAAKESHFSIATFYRFFIPQLLLPQGINKAIYLDSDIIVNLDIAEFWQIDLGDKPLGVVTETDNDVPVEKIRLVKDNLILGEIYFNAGILLMNLRVLYNETIALQAGIKFIGEYPRISCFDQDVLNYSFAASSLKLPIKFNFYVQYARLRDEFNVDDKILHYANGRVSFPMDMNDPYTCLFMDYFLKTPWVDDDTKIALSGGIPSKKNYSVSVVIPMYNAEKHIGECLDSLLIQTFRDFEVIVVDDCSTDLSCEIVESYAPKFNGRLRIEKTEKNSGTDCVPRNIGMMLAHGDYIQFLDSDDMILGTALETLYKAAILYDADVVYTSQHYIWDAPNNVVLYKDGTSRKLNFNTNLVVDDPSTNLARLLLEPDEGNFHAAWTKFVRRDFMITNRILFADLPLAGDFVGVINIYCHARRFLRISTPLYFWKTYNEYSMQRIVRAPQKQCRHWFSSFVKFAEALHELERENEVLTANPLYCLEASKKTFGWTLNQTYNARQEIAWDEFYNVLHSELVKLSSDSLAVLLPFLFSFIDNEKKSNARYIDTNSIINRFKLYFNARIYVGIDKKTEEESIQILSVSDGNAQLSKPTAWQKNGTYHIVSSYRGKLEIIAKAIVEGNVKIRLSGPYVRNPDDKSKRIPYWIDYTKLTVNGEVIFDKVTPVWYDKSYIYNMTAKTDEEIVIQAEWLPHRSDEITPTKFLPYLTARLDTKLTPEGEGDFQIVSVSDDNVAMRKPSWLNKNGVGYVIQSHKGSMKIVAKATANGQLNLNLRGKDVRTPEDKTKRIPYWIDYTKLVVNDKIIFDTLTPAWHDKPYRHNIKVKADQEITIEMEWQPHRSDT